jgi:hypothetical protein
MSIHATSESIHAAVSSSDYDGPAVEPPQLCHFCGKHEASAIIHHVADGAVHVCPSCHVECSDADEILPIPTVLL